MKFKVIKVENIDIKNKFYEGEVFEGDWVELESNPDFTDIIVWDKKNDRGIAPHKVNIL